MPNTTLDERIEIAANEAKRFLRRVRERAAALEGDTNHNGIGPANAAIKRASMDLSRALADLRKGNTYV